MNNLVSNMHSNQFENTLEKKKVFLKDSFKSMPRGLSRDVFNDIYHSESADEMELKLGVSGQELNIGDVCDFASTLTYHGAFWPHTYPRFKAFMKWIDCNKKLRKFIETAEFIDWCIYKIRKLNEVSYVIPVEKTIDNKKHQSFVYQVSTEYESFKTIIPGKKHELKLWVKFLSKALRKIKIK